MGLANGTEADTRPISAGWTASCWGDLCICVTIILLIRIDAFYLNCSVTHPASSFTDITVTTSVLMVDVVQFPNMLSQSGRISKEGVIRKHMALKKDHVQPCTALPLLTSGPKAIILRTHSSVKRAVKTMFKYFSMDSYRSGAP